MKTSAVMLLMLFATCGCSMLKAEQGDKRLLPGLPIGVVAVLKDIKTKTVMKFPEEVKPVEDVSYKGFDPFSMKTPWYSQTRPLPAPQSPDLIQTRFYLYTQKERGRFNLSKSNTEFSAKGSDFVGSRQTYFITHGFASNGNSSWLSDMKDAILKRYKANVILVDWGKGAEQSNYFQVASNTRVVGATLVKLGNYLINKRGANASRFNVIGHSLGAQISSYMCKGIRGVAKLYALDPAQPAFEGYPKEVRVDKSDAKFVQVVHTSSRLFIPLIGLGMMEPYGHVDFYMNGGWDQPGCALGPKPNITSFEDLKSVPVEVLSNFIACPHGRSYLYLTASISEGKNCIFWGHRASKLEILASNASPGVPSKLSSKPKKCDAKDNCSPFGFQAARYPARGIFNVKTKAKDPYCIPEKESDEKMKNFRLKN